MKFTFTLFFLLGFSVSFLYYLFQNQTFLPTVSLHEVNWSNLFVFVTFSFLSLLSLLNLIFYHSYKIFKKEMPEKLRIRESVKFSVLISLGVLVVFALHIFHIISFPWGIGILVVLMLLFFVV